MNSVYLCLDNNNQNCDYRRKNVSPSLIILFLKLNITYVDYSELIKSIFRSNDSSEEGIIYNNSFELLICIQSMRSKRTDSLSSLSTTSINVILHALHRKNKNHSRYSKSSSTNKRNRLINQTTDISTPQCLT